MARILKYFVPEFSGLSFEEIQTYFVDSGSADSDVNIALENSESRPVGEKEVDFDLKFRVRNPQAAGTCISLHLIIDFESQNRHSPGYSLKKRGVYYCARMINGQLPNTGEDRDYDRLEKVYSIWLVTDAPRKTLNTVQTFTIKDQENRTDEACDLMSLSFINIHIGYGYGGTDEAFRFLYSIFSTDDTELKSRFNEDEYKQVKEAKAVMSKPHEALQAAYLSKGIAQGIEQGIEQGIAATVDTALEFGASKEKAIKNAAVKYKKKEEEIIKIYRDYKRKKLNR